MTPARTKQMIGENSEKRSEIGDIKWSATDVETRTKGEYVSCDGRIISKSAYPEYMNVIGYSYGLIPILTSGYINGSTALRGGASANWQIMGLFSDKTGYCSTTVLNSSQGYYFSVENGVTPRIVYSKHSGSVMGGFYHGNIPYAIIYYASGNTYNWSLINVKADTQTTLCSGYQLGFAGLYAKDNDAVLYFLRETTFIVCRINFNGETPVVAVTTPSGVTTGNEDSAFLVGKNFVFGTYGTNSSWKRYNVDSGTVTSVAVSEANILATVPRDSPGTMIYSDNTLVIGKYNAVLEWNEHEIATGLRYLTIKNHIGVTTDVYPLCVKGKDDRIVSFLNTQTNVSTGWENSNGVVNLNSINGLIEQQGTTIMWGGTHNRSFCVPHLTCYPVVRMRSTYISSSSYDYTPTVAVARLYEKTKIPNVTTEPFNGSDMAFIKIKE